MIDALHLIWIIPLSMMVGAVIVVVVACNSIKDSYQKMIEDEECIRNDNRNA